MAAVAETLEETLEVVAIVEAAPRPGAGQDPVAAAELTPVVATGAVARTPQPVQGLPLQVLALGEAVHILYTNIPVCAADNALEAAK